MNLHGQIMNLPCRDDDALNAEYSDRRIAYKHGHRDARHAAAELALKADAQVEALHAALTAIAALDPDKDSDEGLNEWGEADCFDMAQALARNALVLHNAFELSRHCRYRSNDDQRKYAGSARLERGVRRVWPKRDHGGTDTA